MYVFIFMGYSCVCCMYIFIIILYESVYLHNIFVCLKFYISTDEIIFLSGMTQPKRLGMLQYGIRASFFNIEPGWFDQIELSQLCEVGKKSQFLLLNSSKFEETSQVVRYS